jgi:hypothetical protein
LEHDFVTRIPPENQKMRPRTFACSAALAVVAFVSSGRPAGATDALVQAVEYYHPQFEHYFTTATAAEIAALDANVMAGWSRTGQRYRVHADAGPDRVPVCRFYTAAFAGKPSHFYTAVADECEYVKRRLPEWIFEGIAFHVRAPDAIGACGSDTAPVYRLYNDGHGDAPSHAYTTDPAKRDLLLHAGWVAEGTAWCVPLAPEDPAIQTSLLAQTTWELPAVPEIYGDLLTRTTFAAQLDTLVQRQNSYARSGLPVPPATLYHHSSSVWGGPGNFEPLTGRFLILGSSGFEGYPYVRLAWEIESANGPATAACSFAVKVNLDARYPHSMHPFQEVLWSGCLPGVARRL